MDDLPTCRSTDLPSRLSCKVAQPAVAALLHCAQVRTMIKFDLFGLPNTIACLSSPSPCMDDLPTCRSTDLPSRVTCKVTSPARRVRMHCAQVLTLIKLDTIVLPN